MRVITLTLFFGVLLPVLSSSYTAVLAQTDPLHTDGKVWYVSIQNGSNKNKEATRDLPMKNIDKTIKIASPGDVIAIAEGVYSGTRGCGYIICDKPVRLYGGYSSDFSACSNVDHPTVFQPLNQKSQRKAFLKCQKSVDGLVIDGIVFDMGERNSYSNTKGKPEELETGMLLLPPKKEKGDKATTTG